MEEEGEGEEGVEGVEGVEAGLKCAYHLVDARVLR